jgi:MFS family permease
LAIPIALLGLPIIRVMVVPGQDVNYHMGRYVSIITPLFVLLSGIGLSTIIDLYGERIRRVPNSLLVTITIGGLMIGVGMLLLVDNVVLDFARYIYGLRYHSIAFADRWFQIRLLIYTAFIGVMLIGIGIGVYGLASRWRKHDGVQISILNLWMFIALLMGALGVLLNIQLYTGQIANIQEMQVTMGKWAADSTPPDSLLAVNDIGAIGYYSDRRILDTLALINPEVIPFLLKGEKGIFELLVREQPDYLIVFPNWYPNITQLDALFTPVYDVSIEPNLICGARTMVAYKANWDNLALIQDEVDSW